jgi:hypothetical protein
VPTFSAHQIPHRWIQAQTWRRINLELGRLHLVTLAGAAGRVEQTTALTSTQRELFTATGITPPPRVTSLHPA